MDVHDSALKNVLGHATSYHLVPLVPGTSRHAEAFTKKDFWVTLYKPTEMYEEDLPSYVSGESVSNADVVVWFKGSLHHHPRDEDGKFVAGTWKGEA